MQLHFGRGSPATARQAQQIQKLQTGASLNPFHYANLTLQRSIHYHEIQYSFAIDLAAYSSQPR